MGSAQLRGNRQVQRQSVRGNGWPLRHDLNPQLVPITELKQLGQEARRHTKAQVKKFAASLQEFGVVLPVIADRDRRVVAGAALIRRPNNSVLVRSPSSTSTILTRRSCAA
jgi:hypothetical protein